MKKKAKKVKKVNWERFGWLAGTALTIAGIIAKKFLLFIGIIILTVLVIKTLIQYYRGANTIKKLKEKNSESDRSSMEKETLTEKETKMSIPAAQLKQNKNIISPAPPRPKKCAEGKKLRKMAKKEKKYGQANLAWKLHRDTCSCCREKK